MSTIWRYSPDSKFTCNTSWANCQAANTDSLFRTDNYSVAYKIINTEFFETYLPVNDAMLKWNNGGTWITDKPVKYWNGSSWIIGKPVKLWSGTKWVVLFI